MSIYYQSDLARLVYKERLEEAARSARGFCCLEDRVELEHTSRPSIRQLFRRSNQATCSC
jgi:hypothetical protein